jgi:signal transduction histidine kinase
MLLAGIQAEFELDPRLKHSGVTVLGVASLAAAQFSKEAEGMGMVLSICRSIVDAHGGRIRGSRTAGPGATVQLTLPMHGERA